MHIQTQVKHCWRLMEAVIGVEVSTDTPDLKIMRQKERQRRRLKKRTENCIHDRKQSVLCHIRYHAHE